MMINEIIKPRKIIFGITKLLKPLKHGMIAKIIPIKSIRKSNYLLGGVSDRSGKERTSE
ncbi:MAG: hypothetical protein IPP22_08550 [Nitrosomonas sp.]|nr:hypothetical protein [Nitrosomonas sp.]